MAYELNRVSVHFAERTALRNVTCTLREGRWISIVGRSGAGKSTFAHVLKGLVIPDEGEYRIDERQIFGDGKGRDGVIHDVGIVFQVPEHQLFETTVARELAFAPRMQGWGSQRIAEAIDRVLPQVGLSKELLDLAPFQLSGGQRRRVALASVLLMDPALLILDEPTSGLDPAARMEVLHMLREWQRAGQRTVVFISHRMEDVAEYSDEVMVFHDGQMLEHCDVHTLFLQKGAVMDQAGLPLPEAVQLLHLVEELSGRSVDTGSCRETDILEQVSAVWQARSL
ncbi:ATP-binding cassette domain-containing protein [Paenibacillus sp. FSL W8-0426]|uniref:ATP-binding cassette domain-containing protein n=1 Tax=Paenibacillus sp. FSL W8-0426 TaxID=2921714 RepID=UPI0030D8A06C